MVTTADHIVAEAQSMDAENRFGHRTDAVVLGMLLAAGLVRDGELTVASEPEGASCTP